MCGAWSESVRQVVELGRYDEQTWKRLGPSLVGKGEREVLARFKKMGSRSICIGRRQCRRRREVVRVKWVGSNKGTDEQAEVRYRMVAQELRSGDRRNELFAAEKGWGPMLLDVKKCLFRP